MPLRFANRNVIESLQDEERGINLEAYTVEYIIVGGGGQGGPSTTTETYSPTGGGGAGGFITGSFLVKSPTRYYVTVGKGGWGEPSPATLSGNNGETSSIFDIVALGGGGGAGTSVNAGPGVGIRDGGSGGGGSYGPSDVLNLPGSGSAPQGFNGGLPFSSSLGYGGGGGGGAANTGSTNNRGESAGLLGGGPGKAWVDGNIYAKGGDTYGTGSWVGAPTGGYSFSDRRYKGDGSSGMKFQADGTNAQSGSFGIVALRYASGSLLPNFSPVSGSGGELIVSGGYVYHYFTASGFYTA